jgi:hypothetical protein
MRHRERDLIRLLETLRKKREFCLSQKTITPKALGELTAGNSTCFVFTFVVFAISFEDFRLVMGRLITMTGFGDGKSIEKVSRKLPTARR